MKLTELLDSPELVPHGLKLPLLREIARRTATRLGLKQSEVKAGRAIGEGRSVIKFVLTTYTLDPRHLSDRFIDTLQDELKKSKVDATFDGVTHDFRGRKYIDTTMVATFTVAADED